MRTHDHGKREEALIHVEAKDASMLFLFYLLSLFIYEIINHHPISMISPWFEVQCATMVIPLGGVNGCFKYSSCSSIFKLKFGWKIITHVF